MILFGVNMRRGGPPLWPLRRRRWPTLGCARQPARHESPIADVATCSYIENMTSTGIRELKDNLSRYIRRIEAGERIAVTAHGRVVAELVPPVKGSRARRPSRYEELVATGVIRPALEAGDPLEEWPDIRLSRGTAAQLIDTDRGEA